MCLIMVFYGVFWVSGLWPLPTAAKAILFYFYSRRSAAGCARPGVTRWLDFVLPRAAGHSFEYILYVQNRCILKVFCDLTRKNSGIYNVFAASTTICVFFYTKKY